MDQHPDDEIISAPTEQLVTPPPSSAWKLISFLILAVLLIAMIVGLFYCGHRLYTITHQLKSDNQQFKQSLTQTNEELEKVQQSISTNALAIQRWNDELNIQKQFLNEFKTKLSDKKEGWVISEAEYLTKLANINLQMENNIPIAIKLLQTADAEIRDLDNAQLLPLRQVLATDIVALQAVSQIDVSGIYLQLSAMNNQVDKLALLNTQIQSEAKTQNIKTDLPWWKVGLQNSLTALKKLIVIRYHHSDEAPFVAPGEQDFIYQNLHALYMQAMWACIHRQNAVYQISLQNIDTWIKKYFVADSSLSMEMKNNLQKLLSINLTPALPNLSETLKAFQNYSKQSG